MNELSTIDDWWSQKALQNWVDELREAKTDEERDWIGTHGGSIYQEKFPAFYTAYLAKLHNKLRPKVYLEIGVADGATLTCANPPTRVIGIDPEPNIAWKFRAETEIFKMTSDEYFQRDDIPKIDFAFIDGLHLFEQALRDFVHIEKYAHQGTVVAIHDVLPINKQTAQRVQTPGPWTGDVWKVIPILMRYRPMYEIKVLPARPTGLALVTGFRDSGPWGSNLQAEIFDILIEWHDKEWDWHAEDLMRSLMDQSPIQSI